MKKLLRFSVLIALLVAFAAELYAATPGTQAYNITFSSVGPTNVTVNCTRGDGTRRIIVARPYSANVWTSPSNGTDYTTATGNYGTTPTTITAAERVIYRGTGRTVAVTNLTGDTHWQFKVYEFNGSGTTTQYLTSASTNNPREVYLTPSAPTLNATNNIGDKFFTVNWNSVVGASGYDIQVSGTSPFDPTDLVEGYDPYEETSGAATSETIDMNIFENDIYTWKIRTRVGNVYSGWVIDATAINTYPSAPNTGGDVTICSNTATTITPTNDQLNCGVTCAFNFYSAPTGGVPLNVTPTGDPSWTTGLLTSTTTYYVSTYNTANVAGRKESQTRSAYTIYLPAAITAPASITNVNPCNGAANGAINITAAGGIGAYTYNWSGTGVVVAAEDQTGLSGGVYLLTVTDACAPPNTATFSYTVTEPTVVSATTASTNVTCNGASDGTITISAPAGGGGGTYTYAWAGGPTGPTRTGLNSGGSPYVVTVWDGPLACSVSYSIAITQPAALAIPAPTVTNVTCFAGSDGQIALAPTGGYGTYSYLWSNGQTTATATGLTVAGGPYSVTVRDAAPASTACSVVGGPWTLTEPAIVAINPTITNVVCFGLSTGAISTAPTGGPAAGAYAYSWTGPGGPYATQNISSLAAGTYLLTVTKNATCAVTASYTVSQPASAITATYAQTNVSCFGGADGTITISGVSGGMGAPFSYTWSDIGLGTNTRSGLTAAASPYTVTIRDVAGLCGTVTHVFTITEPASAITAVFTPTNVSCFGGANGTAIVSAPGGGTGATYTYVWSDGLSTAAARGGLTAGNYTVTVKDGTGLCLNCVHTFVITQPASAITASYAQTNATCFGSSDGAAAVSAPGGGTGAAYSYVWSDGPTTATRAGLTAGIYTVTVYDSGLLCGNCTHTFTVTQPAAAITASYAQTNVNCFGGTTGSASVTAQGGGNGGPYTYLWSDAGPAIATRTGLIAGGYTVTVKDVSGICLNTTHLFTITEPASAITAAYAQTNVACYGAATGAVAVSAPGGGTGGAYTYVWSDGLSTAATRSGLVAGTYIVTVKDNAGLCLNCIHSFVISQPVAPLSLTATPTATTCALDNGHITLAKAGGTAPYVTYSWSGPGGYTSATSDPAAGNTLAPGAYSVTVTDNAGCTATASCTVNSSAPASITGTFTNETCNLTNGTITTTPSGGTTYTYAWSDGAVTTQNRTGLAGGVSYTVTVTANPGGCTAQATFAVLALYEAPTVTVQPTDQKAADGGSVTFTAAIGDVSTYQWQISTDAGGSWNDVGGATSTSLTVSSLTAAMNGYLYHLTGYTPCSPVTSAVSNNAKLRVYPSTQARSIVWGNVIPGQIPLQWTNGNGDGRICVIRKDPSAANYPVSPTDGTVYTANTSYNPLNPTAAQRTAAGVSTSIGCSQVIYRGTGANSIATGMASYQRYHFKIFEYYGTTDPTFNTNAGTSNNPLNRMSASKEAIPGLYETSTDGSLIVEGLYPNPAVDNITFKLTTAEEMPVTISIFNESGQKVIDFASNQVMASGDHDIRVPFNKMMASGSYVLAVSAGNEMVVYGFSVIK